VRAHRQRGQRGDAGQPPLAAGRLAQGAAKAAQLLRQRDRQVAGLAEQPEVGGERGRVRSSGPIREISTGEISTGEISTVQLTEQVVGEQVTGPDGGQWTSLAAC
jgi:hypothetical protein